MAKKDDTPVKKQKDADKLAKKAGVATWVAETGLVLYFATTAERLAWKSKQVKKAGFDVH